jgi:hypothetical protein
MPTGVWVWIFDMYPNIRVEYAHTLAFGPPGISSDEVTLNSTLSAWCPLPFVLYVLLFLLVKNLGQSTTQTTSVLLVLYNFTLMKEGREIHYGILLTYFQINRPSLSPLVQH